MQGTRTPTGRAFGRFQSKPSRGVVVCINSRRIPGGRVVSVGPAWPWWARSLPEPRCVRLIQQFLVVERIVLGRRHVLGRGHVVGRGREAAAVKKGLRCS